MTDKPEFIEADNDTYKTLLESTKAIPWKIDWKTMQFVYIGPQIEQLLGWAPSSWVSVNDWAERMHPDDKERVVDFCITQSKSGTDHEADYRALTKTGDYVWIRDVWYMWFAMNMVRLKPWWASCLISVSARQLSRNYWRCKKNWKSTHIQTA